MTPAPDMNRVMSDATFFTPDWPKLQTVAPVLDPNPVRTREMPSGRRQTLSESVWRRSVLT